MSDIGTRLMAAANEAHAFGRLLDAACTRIQLLEHTLSAVVHDHPAGLSVARDPVNPSASAAWVVISSPCGADLEECESVERSIAGLRYLHSAREEK